MKINTVLLDLFIEKDRAHGPKEPPELSNRYHYSTDKKMVSLTVFQRIYRVEYPPSIGRLLRSDLHTDPSSNESSYCH